MSKNKSKFLKPSFVIYTWAIFKTGLIFTYSYLSNSWNKRGGGAKVPELINEVVGINVEGWKNSKSVSLSPFIREIWVRGHSKTTWTIFCPIYLPIVDFRGHLVQHLPFVHVVIEENWPPPLLHMWIWQYIYRTRAIISRGLYFFLHNFHFSCGLFYRQFMY